MKTFYLLAALLCICSFMHGEGLKTKIPEKMLNIMHQPKYQDSTWGILVKDTNTGTVLFDLNSNQFFLPGSVSKLFTVSALLHAYGDNYRFKTPVYMKGMLQDGILKGDLILVGQGDLTLGGRETQKDIIEFTKMDHTYANVLPGASLTKGDPLHGLNELAKQIREKGIFQIEGKILIDERLFEKTEKREMLITPVMVNENLIDIVLNPTSPDQLSDLFWRPHVPGYSITNQVKSVAKGGALEIKITSDDLGRKIVVEGTIPQDQKDILRTFSVKDPAHFARAAFIQVLNSQGIKTILSEGGLKDLPPFDSYRDMQPLAVWTSPPLSEYAKLILKVSHNLGANLVPLLLASQKKEKTFEQGMLLLGKFIEKEAKVERGNFVFVDAAGGEDNRLTPQATVQLLDYIHQLPHEQFQRFDHGLPIMGVDGSLADFGKNTDAVGKVRAKPGTGLTYNLAISQYFLTAQALGGYITGKNGHLIEFMMAVNNAQAPEIKDVFSVFEDQAQMTAIIYDLSK